MQVLYRVNSVYKFDSYSDILASVYEISAPLLGIKYLKKSGQSYSLPSPINQKRAESVVARWVIESAFKRSDAFKFEDKLVNELTDILVNKGVTLTKRSDFHKKVVSNRFFMRTYFSKSKKVTKNSINPYSRSIFKKLKQI